MNDKDKKAIGEVYVVGEPEYIGSFPIRGEVKVLSLDEQKQAWSMMEVIEFGPIIRRLGMDKVKWGVLRIDHKDRQTDCFLYGVFPDKDWTYDINEAFRIREEWGKNYPHYEYIVREYNE